MQTASIVLYNNSKSDIATVIGCADRSSISTIYVVDNSPLDNLRNFVIELSPKVKYFHGQGNVGYGAAHNVAIREAIDCGANYHVVLNPDILFNNGTIEELTQYMDSNSDVGQIMPKVFYPNGELQHLCKLIPTPFDLIFKRFFPAKLTQHRLKTFQLQFTGYNKIMNVPYLSGCFMLFRISALKQIGLFDEQFFMYPEDIDITRRMHEQYKTIFYPNVSIIHAHAADSKTSRRMLKVHIVNMIKYFNKWGWIFDSKRRKINREVLKELNHLK